MNKRKFEDIIAEQGKLIYTNAGDSMYPTILPRDLLVIEAVTKPLKKYDIPLYKRDSGQYVLHRIIDIKDNSYVICGDNRTFGVLTAIVRNGQTIAVTTPKHKL